MLLAGKFYTAEREWHEGVRLGDPVTKHLPLRIALNKCVASYDPPALQKLRATGFYKTSGWFLPEERWSNVGNCMRLQDWLLMPVHIYTM